MCARLSDLLSSKGHTTVVWNSRSLLNKIEEIDRISIEASPELIGITESWLSDQIDNDQICVDGYNIHRQHRDRPDKTRGGGLVWYAKTGLNIQSVLGVNNCTNNMESLWVKLVLTQMRLIYYGLIYRPPDCNVNEFLNSLDDIIIELRSRSNCEINLCGDLNINIHKPRDPSVVKYKEYLRKAGLI